MIIFWLMAYSDYPVVGCFLATSQGFLLTGEQKFKNDDQKSRSKQFVNRFRLPYRSGRNMLSRTA